MSEGDNSSALPFSSSTPRKLARELLPLLRVKFLDESPNSLRRLVAPTDKDIKLIGRKMGEATAARVRAQRQEILVELNELLAKREEEQHHERNN